LGDLKAHQNCKIRLIDEPEAWLLEFELHRPPLPSALSAEPFEAQPHDWMTANARRPVVGPEWENLTRDQAEQYIRRRAAEGQTVTFQETWLDRGPALIIK
jgi:hypothetical protein